MNTIRDIKNRDMAILVIGFDGYNDLWDDYFTLLNKYWSDRSFPVYLANNQLKPEYNNVSIINCGADAEWSNKVRVALENIEETYICLLLEDFFTGSKVNNETIINTLDFIKSENIRYYKLDSFSKIKANNYNGMNYLSTIPENLDYGISLQPAIWNRKFLLELLGEGNYNAWKFEYARIAESAKGSAKDLAGCVYDDRNILEIQHAVVQGKYLPPVVEFFEQQNYKVNMTRRSAMTTKEYKLHRVKQIGKKITPIAYRKTVKKFMNNFGMKFVSDKQS